MFHVIFSYWLIFSWIIDSHKFIPPNCFEHLLIMLNPYEPYGNPSKGSPYILKFINFFQKYDVE